MTKIIIINSEIEGGEYEFEFERPVNLDKIHENLKIEIIHWGSSPDI